MRTTIWATIIENAAQKRPKGDPFLFPGENANLTNGGGGGWGGFSRGLSGLGAKKKIVHEP